MSNTIFTYLLKALNVKHTKSFSSKYFNEHPHKNSMYGLSSMLSEYGIDNQGLRIKNKSDALKDLETPFVAKINNDFVVVYNIDSEHVKYIWQDKKISLSAEAFNDKWSGVVLLAEADEQSIEPDYKHHRKADVLNLIKHTSLLFAGVLLLCIIGVNSRFYHQVQLIISLLICMAGIYVCYLLVLKQVQTHSHIADKLCSLLIHQNDCNNILESDASKIFGFSWSEIGLGYFVGNALLIISMPSLYPYVAWINVCILPYTLWSLWYQRFRAKQWCPLCLLVQGVLWLLFFYNLFMGLFEIPTWHVQDILITLCLYILPVLSLHLFNSILSTANLKQKTVQELNSLKSNEQLFNLLIKEKRKYEVDKSISAILLGNPESENLITIISNPHCNPCAQLHKKVKSLLKSKPNDCCIQYIFSSFDRKLEESNKFMIAMYQTLGQHRFLSFLDEWYAYGKYDVNKIFRKYQYDHSDANIQSEFDKHNEWIRKTKIMATPTILYKGYELPSQIYKMEDLILLSGIHIS